MNDLSPNMTDYEATTPVSASRSQSSSTTRRRRRRARPRDAGHPALVALEPDGTTADDFTSPLSARANRAANLLESLGVVVGTGSLSCCRASRSGTRCSSAASSWGRSLCRAPRCSPSAISSTGSTEAEATAAVTDPEGPPKSTRCDLVPIAPLLVVVGGQTDGWVSFDGPRDGGADPTDWIVPTAADDPLLIYFTSGTVAHPEDGAAHAGQLRHRPRDHGALLARLEPDDLHWTCLGHRLGQGRMGQALRAMAGRGGTLALGHSGQARFRSDAAAHRRTRSHDLLRARRRSTGLWYS